MTTEGSYSSHLVNSYMAVQSPRGPFGQPLHVTTHGAMSFAPQMHGTFSTNGGASAFGTQSSMFSDSSFMEMSEESAKKIATLQAKLNKRLGPEFISQRPGPGGGPKLTYAEGWKVINLANEVFGFNGWSSSVVSITTDFIDFNKETQRFNVGVTAIVRVTLRDGVFHEDIGYGLLENSKSKGAALDKCKKEAVTDAVKRSLRNFGNLLGNCLYDKAYTQEVVKIKVPPPKFDRNDLHRRPEFDENLSNPSTSNISHPNAASSSAAGPSRFIVKSEAISVMPPLPARFAHPNATSTPNEKGKAVVSNGVHTPIQTPGPVSAPPQRQPPGGPTSNVGGMAQRTAERHAARLKAIQEAQEAQLHEEEAARAAAAAVAAQEAAAASASSATGPSRASESVPEAPGTVSESHDFDEFDFPSEDDALYASVDLEGLDDGVGRPIDFEEGIGAATEDTNTSTTVSPNGDIQTRDAVRPQPNWLQTNGTSANGQRGPHAPAPHLDPAPQAQRNANGASTSNASGSVSRPQTSHVNQTAGPSRQGNVSASAGSASVSSGNGERSKTPSMGGGFSFPAGQQPNRGQPPLRVGSSSTNSGPGSLKRTAEIMQGLQSARRVQQGMGLQNPPNGSGVQPPGNGFKREPFAALEVGDGGDVKRVRRQ